MDLLKIGGFIARKRKEIKLTQATLGEMLGVTDRAVSKWERGLSLPDVSIMQDLCKALHITLNELLTGEEIEMKDYNEKNEKILLDVIKSKEEADKRLLRIEIVIGFLCVAILLGLTAFASYINMEEWQRVVLILIGLVPFLVALPFMIKIEQTAGYYECQHCHHRYVPTFSSVFWAAHMGRTRKMRCPECGEKTWQKKVISTEKD